MLRVHVYDETEEQFSGAMVSTCIVMFRKEKGDDDGPVRFFFGVSAEMSKREITVKKSELRRCMDNWRALFGGTREKKGSAGGGGGNRPLLRGLFEIKRGIATGANSFFTMSREKAGLCGIPDIALRPLLPKSRYLDSPVVKAEPDGFPAVKPQLVLIDCGMEEIRYGQ